MNPAGACGAYGGFVGRELMDPYNCMKTENQSIPRSIQYYDPGAWNNLFPCPGFLNEEHSMGTSIMAVSFDGGVILGADSRTSTGSYIANRVSDKITAIDKSIYCLRSGSAADTQAVSDYVKYFLDQHRCELGKQPLVKTAANFMKELCYNNKNMLTAGIIVAGWDPVEGGSVYGIPIGGALLKRPYATGGSGSTYIYGYLDSNFKPGMTKDECQRFVVEALSLAMKRDGGSGGVIRTVIIDANGVQRTMIPGDKLPY